VQGEIKKKIRKMKRRKTIRPTLFLPLSPLGVNKISKWVPPKGLAIYVT
jgi:hypothetical protein